MKTIQKSQGGVVILEVLVSIVIFAVGVLGIVGLQAVTAKAGINARFRTEAAALSDELVARAQTWTDITTLTANFTGTTVPEAPRLGVLNINPGPMIDWHAPRQGCQVPRRPLLSLHRWPLHPERGY